MLVLSTDTNVSVHSQSNLARLWEMKYKVAFLINITTLVQFWQDKVIVSWTWAKHVFVCTCRGNKLKNNFIFEYERFTRCYNYENHFIAVSQRWKGSSEKNKLHSQWILVISILKIENYFYYQFIKEKWIICVNSNYIIVVLLTIKIKLIRNKESSISSFSLFI